jgi:hypothetical protein
VRCPLRHAGAFPTGYTVLFIIFVFSSFSCYYVIIETLKFLGFVSASLSPSHLFLSFSLLPSFLFPSLLSLSASKGLSSPVPLSHSHSSHTRSVPIYHYTSGLEGSPRSTRLELRGAFDALYAYLSDELSTSSAGKGQLHI